MSGESLRVMTLLGRSMVTSVASGSGASSLVQPSSKSSRLWISKRPEALVAAPRPRRRSPGRMRSAIAAGLWRGLAADWALTFMARSFGTKHEHRHNAPPSARQDRPNAKQARKRLGPSAIMAVDDCARLIAPAQSLYSKGY